MSSQKRVCKEINWMSALHNISLRLDVVTSIRVLIKTVQMLRVHYFSSKWPHFEQGESKSWSILLWELSCLLGRISERMRNVRHDLAQGNGSLRGSSKLMMEEWVRGVTHTNLVQLITHMCTFPKHYWSLVDLNRLHFKLIKSNVHFGHFKWPWKNLCVKNGSKLARQ